MQVSIYHPSYMSVIFMLDCDCWEILNNGFLFLTKCSCSEVSFRLLWHYFKLLTSHTLKSRTCMTNCFNHKFPLFKHNLCAPTVLSSCPVFQEFPSSCWRHVLHIADYGRVWTSLNQVQTSFNGTQVYNPFPRYFVLVYSECFLLCKCVPCCCVSHL